MNKCLKYLPKIFEYYDSSYRYLDGGSSSSMSNNLKKVNTGINVNSTISKGMKKTKVSTTIEMDSKNFKNNLSSKDNNTISVCSNSNNINNKNNINSIQNQNFGN